MKIGNGISRKMRYGSISAGITAAVLAVVILINIGASVLCSAQRWFIDMTTEPLYTLSEEADNLLKDTIDSANANRAENDPVKVDLIFCADPDMLYGNEMMRTVYYTALAMEKAYPDTIEVSWRNVWSNPSSVDAYRTTSYSSIYQSNVIVASGTEFRVYSYRAFFTFNDEADEEPWAYSGEKNFIKGIRAVTRAEAPICALTTNHGEPWNDPEQAAKYSEFVKVLEGAGYEVVKLNLKDEPIPANCRLIVSFDPKLDFDRDTDFSTPLGSAETELMKLDAYLDKAYSFMVFADSDTPKLKNLEEYLEEWGVAFDRTAEGGTYEVVDPSNKTDSEGLAMIGQYATEGLGSSLTDDMRETGAPKVVFGNALSIKYSPTYKISYEAANEETGSEAFIYGSYYKNNKSRDVFDVFSTGKDAYAYSKLNGNRVQDAEGNDLVADSSGEYKLMTVTRHTRIVGEGQGYTNVYDNSYVCAVGSTDFASNEALASGAYANADVLLGTLRIIGREIEPVGFKPNSLYDATMDEAYYKVTATQADGSTSMEIKPSLVAWAVILAALPVVTLAVCGLVVFVKRKTR